MCVCANVAGEGGREVGGGVTEVCFTSPNAALVQPLQDLDDLLFRQQVAEVGLAD